MTKLNWRRASADGKPKQSLVGEQDFLDRDQASRWLRRRVEESRRQVKAADVAITDDALRAWSLRACLYWAADDEGRCRRGGLQRIARARNYHPGWVDRHVGQPWRDVYERMRRWGQRQQQPSANIGRSTKRSSAKNRLN